MSKLYNLSNYATAHVARKGEKATGYTIAAYTYLNENGAKEYINIYLKADFAQVRRSADGYEMVIPFKDFKIKEKQKRDSSLPSYEANEHNIPF